MSPLSGWSSIKQLTACRPNHEKYFYYALMKHREEQLENFTPTQDHLRYSSSDYHHLQGQAKRVSAPGANPRPASRSKSQFSILNDEHLQSRNSILEPPPSERSYDPYRASKDPIVKDKDGYSVTVHTGASRHSQKQATTQTLRHPPSLRVEALKKEQRRISTASSSASLGNSRASLRSKRTLSRHSMSRASLASSNIPSSPPVIVRPSNKHKRPVNFSHLRKSSTASALDDTQSTNATLTPRKRASRIKQSAPDIRDPLSSPAIYFQSPVRSKKETQASSAAQARQHGHTNSQVINTEARKVSTELGRFCEEAFNRSSGSSSHRTSATASQTPYDTPPSSISNQNSTHSVHGQITPAGPKRPLPEVPAETPNSYAARELAETRNRLAARYVADPSASSQTYTEVLAHLDALLKRPLPAADSKRAVSLPEPKYSAFFSELPAISEEKQPDSDIKRASKDATDSHAGAAEHAGLVKIGAPEKHVPTIRMVEPSSPHRPAPLNIRKTSSATTATLNGNALRSPLDGAAARQKVSRITTPTSPKQLDMFTGRFGGNLFSPTDDSAPTKKRPWWRRNKTPDAGAEKPHSPKSWEDLDDSTRSPASVELDRRAKRISDPRTEMHYMSGALAVQEPASLKGKRPGFLKFFERSPKSYVEQDYGRIRKFHDSAYKCELILISEKEDFEPSTPSTRTGFSGSDRTNPPIRRGRREHAIEDVERSDLSDLGIQQNWLSKFLHIKPATRVTCFQTTRGRTRGEVVRLLDNWRVHGIRDVVLDKERNRIFARLDATNALGLKEVEFVIELFVVLYQGRKKGLSIARWTQRKGAASSFRRVVQEVEARLQSKGLLVSDKEMKKDMEAVLADGLGR